MRPLLFIILAGYAVRCNDASYYVVEMPDEGDSREYTKPFRVYWNVPTMQCKSKKIPFEGLFEKFGIIQNSGDSFRGEKISILYDPGLFPALLKNETSGRFKFRNGGVPQEGDLEKHLQAFSNTVEQSVPEKDFDGIGIIDFESWRPVFRQNFGVLIPYKDISYQIERKLHWFWTERAIQARARERFEEAGRAFMQTTLSVAKQLRPRALWGYYGFPYCFNMASNNMVETCSDKVKQENDKIYWLWSESTALYPSIYSSKELSTANLARLVRGRVAEAKRIARRGTPILPYFWFRYREGGYLSQTDLNAILDTLYTSNASGFIIWGSSNDVNTVEKCNSLLQYTEEVLGPAIAKYTKPSQTTTSTTVSNFGLTTWRPILRDHLHNLTTSKPTLDPEYHWVPPENYTQDIVHYVEQEFKKKPGYNATNNNTTENTDVDLKQNSLMDMILEIFKNDEHVIKSSENEAQFSTKTYDVEQNTTTPTVPNIVTQSPLISLLLKDKKKGTPDKETGIRIEIIVTTKKFDNVSETTTSLTTRGYNTDKDKNKENSNYKTYNPIDKENITTTEQNQVTDEYEETIYDLLERGTDTPDPTSTTEENTMTEVDSEVLAEILSVDNNMIITRIERSTEPSMFSTFDSTDGNAEKNTTLSTYEEAYTSQDFTDVPLEIATNTFSTAQDLVPYDTSTQSIKDLDYTDTPSKDTFDIISQIHRNTKNLKKGYASHDTTDSEINLLPSTVTMKFTEETISSTIHYEDILYNKDTEKLITDIKETDEYILLGVNKNVTSNNTTQSMNRKKDLVLGNDSESTNTESRISVQELRSTTEFIETDVPDVEQEGFRIGSDERTTEAKESDSILASPEVKFV